MIRLRDSVGRVIPLPADCKFVEVCDLDGSVGQVIYPDARGFIRVVGPGDKECERYAKLFGIKWSRLIMLPELPETS